VFKLIEYYGRFQGVRGQVLGLPGWARGLIFLAALPGIALIALSILALLVSILALLLLTVPLYRVLRAVAGTALPTAGRPADEPQVVAFPGDLTSPGRKKVDVTIIE
jgi:hypothetical protein